jgi:hypothetical protein
MPSISDFKGSFTSLARPTLFKVEGLGAGREMEFLCKATSVPESTLGVIEVPFQGRKIKIPGDRTFAEWNLTIINDDRFVLRNYFEDWMGRIGGAADTFGENNSVEAIKEDAQVSQLGIDGSVIATWSLTGCFPTIVAAQEFDAETTDTFSECSVTLAFDYFERK